MSKTCSICNRRKARRFCPGKGESICSICCGTEREVTIDCPADCPYLVAARRYDDERRQPLAELPYKDVRIDHDFLHEHEPFIAGFSYNLGLYAREHPVLADPGIQSALQALVETYRTLESGIYYERPPDGLLARELYQQLQTFVAEFRKKETERVGLSTIKDADVFRCLVFLTRLALSRANGRPRGRAFLDWVRAQFPPGQFTEKAPHIIVPGA